MKAVAVWLLLSLIWGSTWLFIKVGLADLPPFTFAGVRFAVAIPPLALLAAARRAAFPLALRDWAFMVVTGVMTFGVTYGLVFWGEQYISSGLAALLFATFPLFGLLIAHLHLPTERMTRRKVVGVALGVLGVAIVFSNELEATGRLALWGSAAIVIAALTAAYTDVWIKLRARHFDPVVLTLVQMIAGTVPLLTVGTAIEGSPLKLAWTPVAVVSLLYLAVVGSALAFVLLYWLIKHMDVTKTMLITLVTPLVAVLLGMAVLDEALTWRTATGGAAILSGLGLTLRRRPVRLVPPLGPWSKAKDWTP
jgi:drug/metabolite transporter (DMT)-like permease